MRRAPWGGALALGLLAVWPAQAADDDEAIPYSEQEEDQDRRRELPRQSDPSTYVREETDVEKQDREESLTHLDDPNLGLAFEAIGGVMLIDSSRGAVGEARFFGGFRFTWEFARLIPDEFVREMFFLDAIYGFTQQTEGTGSIFVTTAYHFVAVAPAVAIPLGGPRSVIAAYVQGGFGFAVTPTVIHTQVDEQTLSGSKFVMQYGGGLRLRPPEASKVRFSFRFEFTRFRRGYMDDTLLGGSLGVSF